MLVKTGVHSEEEKIPQRGKQNKHLQEVPNDELCIVDNIFPGDIQRGRHEQLFTSMERSYRCEGAVVVIRATLPANKAIVFGLVQSKAVGRNGQNTMPKGGNNEAEDESKGEGIREMLRQVSMQALDLKREQDKAHEERVQVRGAGWRWRGK